MEFIECMNAQNSVVLYSILVVTKSLLFFKKICLFVRQGERERERERERDLPFPDSLLKWPEWLELGPS